MLCPHGHWAVLLGFRFAPKATRRSLAQGMASLNPWNSRLSCTVYRLNRRRVRLSSVNSIDADLRVSTMNGCPGKLQFCFGPSVERGLKHAYLVQTDKANADTRSIAPVFCPIASRDICVLPTRALGTFKSSASLPSYCTPRNIVQSELLCLPTFRKGLGRLFYKPVGPWWPDKSRSH